MENITENMNILNEFVKGQGNIFKICRNENWKKYPKIQNAVLLHIRDFGEIPDEKDAIEIIMNIYLNQESTAEKVPGFQNIKPEPADENSRFGEK